MYSSNPIQRNTDNPIEVSQTHSAITLTYHWKKEKKRVFAIIFSVLSVLFVLFILPLFIDLEFSSLFKAPLMLLPFSIYIYILSGYWFNQTIITVNKNGRIKVKTNPLPWWKGNNDIDKNAAIRQIFVKRERHGGKNRHYRYPLMVTFENGISDCIFQHIPSYHTAHFMEQKIEAFLNIENVREEGEFDPNEKKDMMDRFVDWFSGR